MALLLGFLTAGATVAVTAGVAALVGPVALRAAEEKAQQVEIDQAEQATHFGELPSDR